MIKKAVCLISGGLDSYVASSIAKDEGYSIYALSFYYGQKHNKELESAKNLAYELNCIDHVVFNIDIDKFGGSTLLDKLLNINNNKKLEDIGKVIPPTYVPARNTIFLSIALAYSEVINANAIYIGVNATDYSGYPDCRPEYIKAYQKMANLATKKGIEEDYIKIQAPLLYLSKAEIIKKGYELNISFEKTWSCYKGNIKPCGKCESCLLRLKGFKEAKVKDPLKYEILPDWY
jgi:7-cyano-7-deazaguanine synthase